MKTGRTYDAVVVGSGPNGLAAAITLAQAGRSVRVIEGAPVCGGGLRSEELTLPGFVHDACSAIHPLAVASPFFRTLPLAQRGVRFIQPPSPLAHPLDDGRAVLMSRSIAGMRGPLGSDYKAYERLLAPFVEASDALMGDALSPLLRWPRHPLLMARFGLQGLRSARALATDRFKMDEARALFAGHAAHSCVALEEAGTASFGMMLAGLAHAAGWPLVEGGSQRLADGLVAHLRSLGAEIETGVYVRDLKDLPDARVVLLDVTPRQFAAMAGDRLPGSWRDRIDRFRHGPGVFKLDWALSEPIPWSSPDCARAATVHIGGTLEEIAASESAAWHGQVPETPFVLLAQPTLFDPTRAPAGKHIAWAYCHVPNGCTADMTERIEAQVERFAPGFRDCILMRSIRDPRALQGINPNYIGGDISGGANHLSQLLMRPFLQACPYATAIRGVYLCSSSTPPGAGVHGMCGHQAALAALRREF